MTTIDSTSAHPMPVAVVEGDPRARARVGMLLGDLPEAVVLPTLDELQHRYAGGSVVAVLGPSYADALGLAQVERLVRERPDVPVVLVVNELRADVMQQALRLGIRDVVLIDDGGQLREALDRVAASPGSGRTAVPTPVPGSVPAAPAGKIITVFSTKGGAGKSVIACNLALVLARRSTRPVVLMDADLQFGDVAVMLKMAPQSTIVDVVANVHRLDPPLLQSLLVRHPSGLNVLPAPIDPAFVDQITPQHLMQILDHLTAMAGTVVIDTPAQFSEQNLAVLERSDEVLLIAGLDIPNIKNVKLGLQTLRLLNMPMEKIHLVLNRANSKVKLDVAEVERTLQMRAESMIPSDIVVPQSVNKGVPAVIDAPKSSVAKAIEQLADRFMAGDPARRRR